MIFRKISVICLNRSQVIPTVPMLKWQSQLWPSWRKVWNVQFATRSQGISPSPAVRQVTSSVNHAEPELPLVQPAEEVWTPISPAVLQQTKLCWSTTSVNSHSTDVISRWSWTKLLFMRKLVRRELSFVLAWNAREKCSWGTSMNTQQSLSVSFPWILELKVFWSI